MSRPSAFAATPLDSASHFQVHFYAAVFHLLDHLRRLHADDVGELDALLGRHRFLGGYMEAAEPHLPNGLLWSDAPGWWARQIRKWEVADKGHALPLRALDTSGVDFPMRMAVLIAGIVDEDPRFGAVFSEIQTPGNRRRPTLATIASATGRRDAWELAQAFDRIGIVTAPDQPDDSFVEGTPRLSRATWSVLRGDQPTGSAWFTYHAPEALPEREQLVFTDEFERRLENLVQLLDAHPHHTVILRGVTGSGRHRVAGAVARAAGYGVVRVAARDLTAARVGELGLLCTLLRAVPVVSFDVAPGETAALPEFRAHAGPTVAVMGVDGGLEGLADGAITLSVPSAGPEQRRRVWQLALPTMSEAELARVTDRMRLPIEHVERVAVGSLGLAQLDGRSEPGVADVRAALSTLNRQRLDTLATRLDPVGGWEALVVDDQAGNRLSALERRCRHRERVLDHVGPAFTSTGSGVRALFTGPSGTGKTLAARILAAELTMDLYRVDLAAIVNKYVGETEKNLHRVLSTAEELDVVLLIDEGDSLLGSRTEVRSANDRFANLETNYLLQRLETYEGIVIVTTNAAENIDHAFQRRMDAVVTFVEPGPSARWEIWQRHLPVTHEVAPDLLAEIASRADMTGGQIRNAALQATLLALDEDSPVRSHHVEQAVAVEYGKAGAVSPLRSPTTGVRRTRAEAFLEALP